MVLLDRARVVWTGVAGSPYYSNFYFIAEIEQGGALAIQDRVQTALGFLQPWMPSSMLGTIQSEIARIDSVTGDMVGAVGLGTQTVQGSSGSEPEPRATQGLVRLKTNDFVAGRRISGRFFAPGVVSAANNSGVPDNSYRAALEDFANSLIGAGDVTWVVWSRKNGDAYNIVSAEAWTQFAILRSRRD